MFSFLAKGHPCVKKDDANTFRVRVQTHKHKDIVEIRFTKSAHIGIDDDGNYVFRKQVVSSKNFDRGEVVIRFNKKYVVEELSGTQLDFIPITQWV